MSIVLVPGIMFTLLSELVILLNSKTLEFLSLKIPTAVLAMVGVVATKIPGLVKYLTLIVLSPLVVQKKCPLYNGLVLPEI